MKLDYIHVFVSEKKISQACVFVNMSLQPNSIELTQSQLLSLSKLSTGNNKIHEISILALRELTKEKNM